MGESFKKKKQLSCSFKYSQFSLKYKLDILMKQFSSKDSFCSDFNVGSKLNFTNERVCLQHSLETPQSP